MVTPDNLDTTIRTVVSDWTVSTCGDFEVARLQPNIPADAQNEELCED